MKLLAWLALAMVLHMAAPAKILTILPVKVRSHSILFDRLLKEMAIRGHEITYLTPFESKTPTKNIEEIMIPDCRELFFGRSHFTILKSNCPVFQKGMSHIPDFR